MAAPGTGLRVSRSWGCPFLRSCDLPFLPTSGVVLLDAISVRSAPGAPKCCAVRSTRSAAQARTSTARAGIRDLCAAGRADARDRPRGAHGFLSPLSRRAAERFPTSRPPGNTSTAPLGSTSRHSIRSRQVRASSRLCRSGGRSHQEAHEDAPWTDVCSDLCTLSALRAQARNAAQHVSL